MPSPISTPPISMLAFAALLAAGLVAGACGDSDDDGATGAGAGGGSGGTGGVDDGKFHPPEDGTEVESSAACDQLVTAIADARTALGCVLTVPTCPSFVELAGGAACGAYDGGTVAGCADYYEASADCDELKARVADCAVSPLGDDC